MAGDLRVASRRTRGIEARVDAGTLPPAANGPTWAGRGSGWTCAACDERIDRTEMELESILDNGMTLRFHLECFTAWWKVMEARRGIVAL
jgi:hypothetical protein